MRRKKLVPEDCPLESNNRSAVQSLMWSTFWIFTRRQTGKPIVFGKLREGIKNMRFCLLLPLRVLLGMDGDGVTKTDEFSEHSQLGGIQRCLLQSVSCFDLSQYNCWKNIPWTLKWLFCINFMLKKPCFKFQNRLHKDMDWKWPPPPPFGSFPRIHPFWYPDSSLSSAIQSLMHGEHQYHHYILRSKWLYHHDCTKWLISV